MTLKKCEELGGKRPEDELAAALQYLSEASMAPSIMTSRAMQILDVSGLDVVAEAVSMWGVVHPDCDFLFNWAFVLRLANARGDGAAREFNDALGKLARRLEHMSDSEKSSWKERCRRASEGVRQLDAADTYEDRLRRS